MPRPLLFPGIVSVAVGLALNIVPATTTVAQDSPGRPSAADLFEQTLAAEGLDTALVQLNAALADSSEPYAIDPVELGLRLPARLVLRHQRIEALELVKALHPIFDDNPRYWQELGNAHIRCGYTEEACEALTQACVASENRPDLVWMVEHLDDLVANAKRQAEREEGLVPRESTRLPGPYLGQSPPGQTPEVFAPGVLSTTAHEYHISFAPDGREIYFSRGSVGTLLTRWRDDGWTAPEKVTLIDEDHLTEEANLTPDGRAIVFCGRSALQRERELNRAERTPDGWSTPT